MSVQLVTVSRKMAALFSVVCFGRRQSCVVETVASSPFNVINEVPRSQTLTVRSDSGT